MASRDQHLSSVRR
ncbi:hypothetical protein LINPERPRIM_LOCUS31887 [Linum perenne]